MNIFLTVVGVLAVVAGIILACIAAYYKREYSEKRPILKTLGIVLTVFGLLFVICFQSFTIVPTGYTGVKTTFGQVSKEVMPEGFNFKIPFVQNINLVNNKQQDIKFDSQIWGESKEKTPVYAADMVVTYKVSSKKAAWIFSNVSDTDDLINQNIVASAFKSATVELEANEVTHRSKIEPLVREKLQLNLTEKYGKETITVLKIVINQMDFEEEYNKAIAEKSIALQTQEKQKIENETNIAKAEAEKKVAITNAEAKAESVKIAADAEAEANNKIKASLNDDIIRSKFYDKWNGELPNAMGSDTVITSIDGSGAINTK